MARERWRLTFEQRIPKRQSAAMTGEGRVSRGAGGVGGSGGEGDGAAAMGGMKRANMERRRRGDGRRRWASVPWACAAHSRHLVRCALVEMAGRAAAAAGGGGAAAMGGWSGQRWGGGGGVVRGDDGRPSRGIVLLSVGSVVDDSPLPPRNKHHKRFALTFELTFDPRFLAASVVVIVVVVHINTKPPGTISQRRRPICGPFS